MGMNALYYLGFGMAQTAIMVIYITGIFMSIGIWHAYLVHEKKSWLKKVLAKGDYSDDVKSKLESELTPVQSFPLYKYLKFYLASISVVLIVSGLLTILLPSGSSGDVMKALIFIPLLVGGLFYFLYTSKFSNNGLFRELTGAFLFSGFAITFIGFFQVYNFDFIRLDIQAYIVLAVGLFLISHLNSVIASYLYLVAMLLVSTMMPMLLRGGSEWLEFLHLLVWPFGLASLLYWKPRLEAATKIEFREITFGVLFMAVMISLGINNTYGFTMLAMLVIVPSLYMFSLTYYKEANWYLEKPIQTSLGILIFYALIIFSTKNSLGVLGGYEVYIKGWGVMKAFSLLIIAAIGYFAYTKYNEEFSSNQEAINLKLLAGLGVLFVASLLGNDLRGDYLVFLYAVYLGYDYTARSLRNKDEIIITFGVMLALVPVIMKIIEIVGSEMSEKIVAGIVLLGIGGIVGATVVYLRSQWTVSEKNDVAVNDYKESSQSDVLDQ